LTAAKRLAFAVAAALAFSGFIALGGWQLERRAWKHALIARVEQRAHATPVAAPAPAEWSQVSATRDEYRRVRVTGSFLHDAEALVQASTELGAGWWVLTPLRQTDGTIILVNRGFVPPERRDRRARPADNAPGEVAIVGLLRMTEQGAGFLRHNDPAAERWYSRDVAAIAAARRLGQVAPYFVDAERTPSADVEAPVGGLTVVDFHDNHLVYAFTWFALAASVAAAAVTLVRIERRARVMPD
jgi:surfeit locus 1 family protein